MTIASKINTFLKFTWQRLATQPKKWQLWLGWWDNTQAWDDHKFNKERYDALCVLLNHQLDDFVDSIKNYDEQSSEANAPSKLSFTINHLNKANSQLITNNNLHKVIQTFQCDNQLHLAVATLQAHKILNQERLDQLLTCYQRGLANEINHLAHLNALNARNFDVLISIVRHCTLADEELGQGSIATVMVCLSKVGLLATGAKLFDLPYQTSQPRQPSRSSLYPLILHLSNQRQLNENTLSLLIKTKQDPQQINNMAQELIANQALSCRNRQAITQYFNTNQNANAPARDIARIMPVLNYLQETKLINSETIYALFHDILPKIDCLQSAHGLKQTAKLLVEIGCLMACLQKQINRLQCLYPTNEKQASNATVNHQQINTAETTGHDTTATPIEQVPKTTIEQSDDNCDKSSEQDQQTQETTASAETGDERTNQLTSKINEMKYQYQSLTG
jgi:hypothetical protein